MKLTKNMVKLKGESRGGDAPYGWSDDAVHLIVFGMKVETYRESQRTQAQVDAEKWREAIENWKEK